MMKSVSCVAKVTFRTPAGIIGMCGARSTLKKIIHITLSHWCRLLWMISFVYKSIFLCVLYRRRRVTDATRDPYRSCAIDLKFAAYNLPNTAN